ncbi:dethiobiotin synthase [Roseiconus lacunae]|uniref:dethiobiotin synthase n=1 Tax=Roseiconus lacunae TaxID=2605694 RepID=UPI001E58D393|nr:dethiobiotin synthase [Roseiconus lacunae]MCD0462239.1 dethiobiotin synthase [Roseiconus lacunae]WRQ50172.1 dethiobiotin synthase [Stieleria sp. HD01]
MKLTFVSGTGTDVGKTYVAATFAKSLAGRGHRIGVYKPVASGCIGQSNNFVDRVSIDADLLTRALDGGCTESSIDPLLVCPQRFLSPTAPDAAARTEGSQVDPRLLYEGALRWQPRCDHLIVEGAGGLFSPIADELLNIDLYRQFLANGSLDCQLVLVAPNRLGVLHDTIATYRAAIACGVSVDRLFLNTTDENPDPSVATNAIQLRKWLPELHLIEVDWQATAESFDF